MKRLKKKLMSLLLTAVLILGIANPYNVSANENSGEVYEVVEKGIKYTIQVLNDGNEVIVTTDNSDDKYVIGIAERKLSIKEYEYEGKNVFGESQYDVSNETIDISNYIQNVENPVLESRAISYGSKTTVKWSKHWYRYGSSGQKSYIKVGHTAQYRIRTDKLSSSKEAKCDNYANAIKKSNSYYSKALAYAGGSGALLGVAAGLVASNIAFPPTVIVTIVVAAVGGGGSMVNMINALIDSYGYYKDCKDLYAVIKGYGVKL